MGEKTPQISTEDHTKEMQISLKNHEGKVEFKKVMKKFKFLETIAEKNVN